jgi:hypothetical protein
MGTYNLRIEPPALRTFPSKGPQEKQQAAQLYVYLNP